MVKPYVEGAAVAVPSIAGLVLLTGGRATGGKASTEEKVFIVASVVPVGKLAALKGWLGKVPVIGRFFRSEAAAATTAYEAALAGGRHAGTLRNYAGRPLAQIQKGIASYEDVVALHLEKIANPEQFAERWGQMGAQEQAGLLAKWQKDAARNQELADVLRGLAESMR